MAPSENFHRTLRFLSVLLSLSYINCYINCMHQNCVLYQNLEKGISLWFLQVNTGGHMRQFLSIHYIYKQSKMTAFFSFAMWSTFVFFQQIAQKIHPPFRKIQVQFTENSSSFFWLKLKNLYIPIYFLKNLHIFQT